MAIFMDTGGGDIYAAETKEACLDAMKKEVGDKEFQFYLDEDTIEEVPGDMKMRTENEDGSPGPMSTLADQYVCLGYGYCICSENC